MTPNCMRKLRALTGALAVGLGWAGNQPLHAFPPAPHHTIYGQIRDELGNPLTLASARVILETLSGVQVSSPLSPLLATGFNYELRVPMDAGLTAEPYKPTALRPTVAFKISVRLGNTTYLPIEMRGDYANLGEPAGRTRIDLTLGEDLDGDGLPDAWERALLAAAGGEQGLEDINGGDDFDGDGLSNLDEYLAGTYAFDPADGFALTLTGSDGAAATLEFLGLRHRTYALFGSSDLTQWQPLPFRVLPADESSSERQQYRPTDTALVRLQVAPGTAAMRFFKLMVQ